MKQNIYCELPIFMREAIDLLFTRFLLKARRHDPKITYKIDHDKLDYLPIIEFAPEEYSEAGMTKITFPLLPPHEEFSIKLSGLASDSGRRAFGYSFELSQDLADALGYALASGSGVRGSPVFKSYCRFLTLSAAPAEHIVTDFHELLERFKIIDLITHVDLFSNIAHDTPPKNRDSLYRFALSNHQLTFLPAKMYQERQARVITARATGGRIVQIPASAGPLSVRPVPGNEAEMGTELAQLTAQLEVLKNRITEIAERGEEESRLNNERGGGDDDERDDPEA